MSEVKLLHVSCTPSTHRSHVLSSVGVSLAGTCGLDLCTQLLPQDPLAEISSALYTPPSSISWPHSFFLLPGHSFPNFSIAPSKPLSLALAEAILFPSRVLCLELSWLHTGAAPPPLQLRRQLWRARGWAEAAAQPGPSSASQTQGFLREAEPYPALGLTSGASCLQGRLTTAQSSAALYTDMVDQGLTAAIAELQFQCSSTHPGCNSEQPQATAEPQQRTEGHLLL